MPTPLDIRQSISRDTLDQLTGAANSGMDEVTRALNAELTPPLRLRANSTPDQTVNIDSMFTQNPSTLRNYTIPTISNALPNFTGGTVTVPTVSGGNVVVTPGNDTTLTLSVGNFIKMGISMDANGQLIVQFGAEGASVSAATAPPSPDNTFAIGYVVLENNGGVIQPITDSNIYQYVGGGGGGGTGNANSLLETFKNQLQDSVYGFLTPNIFSVDKETLVDASSTGSYDLVSNTYNFSAAGQFLLSTQMLDADFLNDSKDVGQVDLTLRWDDGKEDTAATYEVSRDGGNTFQSISMTKVGETGTYIGTHIFSDPTTTSTVNEPDSGTQAGFSLSTSLSNNRRLATEFTLSQESIVKDMTMQVRRSASGTIPGNFRYAIYSKASGLPDQRLAYTSWYPVQNLPVNPAAFDTIKLDTVSDVQLVAGNYFMVIETDDDYVNSGASINIQMTKSTNAGQSYRFNLVTSVWEVVSNTDKLSFLLNLTIPYGASILDSNAVSNSTVELDATNILKLGQQFTLANASTVLELHLDMVKTGSPSGNIYIAIAEDSAGDPGNILAESQAIPVSQLFTGTNIITIPSLALKAGTYHWVLRTDSAYQSSFVASTTSMSVDIDTAGTPVAKQWNGTAWSSSTGETVYQIKGRVLDLRVKVTSSASDKAIEGYGILYDKETGQVFEGTAKIEKFKFKAVADNLNSFTVTRFQPNPDFVKVYYVETGQVFKLGAFTLQGSTLIFPANTFNNGGVEADVTLIVLEEGGGAYDNSDNNALLLAGNHLGSTDATIDKSQSGRGIFLRRPDGTLREVALDDSDNIVIYSV